GVRRLGVAFDTPTAPSRFHTPRCCPRDAQLSAPNHCLHGTHAMRDARPPRNYFVRSFRRDAGMLSRVADSMYWMSRYLERAEHTAGLFVAGLPLWPGHSPETGAGRWRFLLEALRTPAGQGPIDPTRLVDSLVFSRKNSSSIVSCIAIARENLRHVREQCSSEMWEQLNRLYLEVMDARPE